MKISVVMSVFDGAEHVAATIDSILAQSEDDFEFVIVDDGSTDDTPRILRHYASRDARIRVITQANAGLTRALIAGCAAARAPLIARQDSGDVSHPDRLKKQAAMFDRWPELAFVSCSVDFAGPEFEHLNTSSARGTGPAWILDPARTPPVIDGPSHHGSVMFRRDVYERAGGYRSAFYYGQDWDLWLRMAEIGPFAGVPETLYTARIFPESISIAARERQEALAELSRQTLLARKRGESETAILARAAAITRAPRSSPANRAEGLYFIGEALRRNRDPRARQYLRSAIAARPLSPRAWIRYLQALPR